MAEARAAPAHWKLQGSRLLRGRPGASARAAAPGADHRQRGKRGHGLRLRRQPPGCALPRGDVRHRAIAQGGRCPPLGRPACADAAPAAAGLARGPRLGVGAGDLPPSVRRPGGAGWARRGRPGDRRPAARSRTCRRGRGWRRAGPRSRQRGQGAQAAGGGARRTVGRLRALGADLRGRLAPGRSGSDDRRRRDLGALRRLDAQRAVGHGVARWGRLRGTSGHRADHSRVAPPAWPLADLRR